MTKKNHMRFLWSWLVIMALDVTAFIFTHLYLLADKVSARLKQIKAGNATR